MTRLAMRVRDPEGVEQAVLKVLLKMQKDQGVGFKAPIEDILDRIDRKPMPSASTILRATHALQAKGALKAERPKVRGQIVRREPYRYTVMEDRAAQIEWTTRGPRGVTATRVRSTVGRFGYIDLEDFDREIQSKQQVVTELAREIEDLKQKRTEAEAFNSDIARYERRYNELVPGRRRLRRTQAPVVAMEPVTEPANVA